MTSRGTDCVNLAVMSASRGLDIKAFNGVVVNFLKNGFATFEVLENIV